MKVLLTATLLAATLLSGAAFAGERCNVAASEWQPTEVLEAKLKADGWDVRSIKSEDGCYEAYATDAQGNKVEAYFNPKTLDRLDIASDEDDEG